MSKEIAIKKESATVMHNSPLTLFNLYSEHIFEETIENTGALQHIHKHLQDETYGFL